MTFVTDKAALKPGLIIFRRGDVDHRMWYYRMKIPKSRSLQDGFSQNVRHRCGAAAVPAMRNGLL